MSFRYFVVYILNYFENRHWIEQDHRLTRIATTGLILTIVRYHSTIMWRVNVSWSGVTKTSSSGWFYTVHDDSLLKYLCYMCCVYTTGPPRRKAYDLHRYHYYLDTHYFGNHYYYYCLFNQSYGHNNYTVVWFPII